LIQVWKFRGWLWQLKNGAKGPSDISLRSKNEKVLINHLALIERNEKLRESSGSQSHYNSIFVVVNLLQNWRSWLFKRTQPVFAVKILIGTLHAHIIVRAFIV